MHNKTLQYLRGERDVVGRSSTSASESAPTKSFGEKLKKRQAAEAASDWEVGLPLRLRMAPTSRC